MKSHTIRGQQHMLPPQFTPGQRFAQQTEFQVMQNNRQSFGVVVFLCILIEVLTGEAHLMLCELHRIVSSHHAVGTSSPNLTKVITYMALFFVLWPSPSTSLVHKNIHTHVATSLKSSLQTLVIHFSRPLAERGVQRETGSCTPHSLQY